MKKIAPEEKDRQQLRSQITTIHTWLKNRQDLSCYDFLQDTYGAYLWPWPVQPRFGACAPKGNLRIAKAYNYTLTLKLMHHGNRPTGI